SARYRRRPLCTSSRAPSGRFPPPRHQRRAKGALAARISSQPFAVFLDFESARERAKLPVAEQKARIAWKTDRSLVNQERIGDQNAAGSERPDKFWEQRAVEEVYVHDGVERFVLEMKAIQVCGHGPDGQSRAARSRGEDADRFGGGINRDHRQAGSCERERVAPASCGDVERDAARQSREHRGQERLGFAGRLAAMASVPIGASRFAHSTRASVNTSTQAAPAAINTRAHSSTVAPVVITSSTIS